jgi:hypothetical protein
MSRAIRPALILCLASTASLAQIAAERTPIAPPEADCPIGIRGTVEKNEHPLAGQRLEVTLTKWPSFAIVASRITIHGTATVANSAEPSEITRNLDLKRIVDYARPAPTSNVPYASTEQKKTPAGQGPLAELNDIFGPLTMPVLVRRNSPDSRWYAWVTGFAAVNSIDLKSVSYADGTSWHVANGKTCRVLVGSPVW